MANELQTTNDAFNTLRREMDRLFAQFSPFSLSTFGRLDQGQSGSPQHLVLAPPAEVIEDDSGYRIITELPGIDPREVEVNLTGSTLTIRAERQHEEQRGQGGTQQGGTQAGQQQQGTRGHYLVRERSYGSLRREFRLPDDVDRNRINAEFRNGLLTLTVPKSQEARDQRRRIEIKSS